MPVPALRFPVSRDQPTGTLLATLSGVSFRVLALLGTLLWAGTPAWAARQRLEAPNVTLRTLEGKAVSLKRLRGKPVLLNFWATNCGYCLHEMPNLEKYYREVGKRKLAMIGVASSYDDPKAIRKVIREKNLSYRMTHDTDGSVGRAFGGIRGTPTSILISPTGRIMWTNRGVLDMDRLRRDMLAFGVKPPAPPKPGERAPNVLLHTLHAGSLRLSELFGRPVLLNFWSTDCGDCALEMDYLNQFHGQATGFLLVTIGIAAQHNTLEEVRTIMQVHKLSYTMAHDTDGQVSRAFGGIPSKPTSVFISPQGRIVWMRQGPLDMNYLQQSLLEAPE